MAYTLTKTARPREIDRQPITFTDVVINEQSKTLDHEALIGARDIEIVGIRITYAASAVVGTRKLLIEAKEGTPILMTYDLPDTTDIVAAGSVIVNLAPGQAAASVGTEFYDFLPPDIHLQAGQTLTVSAASGSDAADDMTVTIRALVR